MLQIGQNDVIHTYELLSPEEKYLLHSQYSPGSYDQTLWTRDQNIIYGWLDKFYIYNYIGNNLRSIDLPENHIYTSVSSSRAGTYLIRARHEITHENLEVLYDPTLGLIHLDDASYSDLFAGTALKREHLDNGQYQNILFDYQANSFDTLLTQIDRVSYEEHNGNCLLYTSPSPRDGLLSRMPSSA